MLTAVSMPLMTTYQQCSNLESKEMMDLLDMNRLGQQAEAQIQTDDNARMQCARRLNVYASAGEAIFTHGEK